MLHGKNILVGVTGSIAAYKAATLVRLLVKSGANVKVVMTDDAKGFITPLTLSTLSKNKVFSSFSSNKDTGEWNNHVALGLWADLIILAPITANTIAKMAHGLCDNLLMAVYLSSKCPVFIAPAMDLDMYIHPSTNKNLETIQTFGNFIIQPNSGELASGLVGEGRMAEPEEIITSIENHFSERQSLQGKKILITAGPTYENIDPVRFIGNHSSGKMGIAIAEEASKQGAEVHLVLGPSSQKITTKAINVIAVVSAQDMFTACNNLYPNIDCAILSAAVADYRPKNIATDKIKKENMTGAPVIELEKTPDILHFLGEHKKQQLLVGFALETSNEIANAKAKIKRKNLDFIILNSLNDKGAGFSHDTNKITIIDSKENIQEFDLKSKKEVAVDIINKVIERLQ